MEAFRSGGSVTRDETRIGTIVDADAFNGVNGYMTRMPSGNILLQDGSGDALYEVDVVTGASSLFMDEWTFEEFDGPNNSLDLGLAYDANGDLFVASTANAAIVKVEPGGVLSTFVTLDEIAIATGAGDAELFGLAFARETGSPIDGIAAIIATIEGLVDDGKLKRGQGNGMIRPLRNALRSLGKNKTISACSQIRDFIDTANGKIADGALDPTDGNPLISAGMVVRNQLGC